RSITAPSLRQRRSALTLKFWGTKIAFASPLPQSSAPTSDRSRARGGQFRRPPLGLAAKLFLGIVALFWVVYSAERFAAGRIGQGFASIVVGVLAVLLRWGIIDGINRRRWENPQYRRLHTPEDDRRAAE